MNVEHVLAGWIVSQNLKQAGGEYQKEGEELQQFIQSFLANQPREQLQAALAELDEMEKKV